MQTELDLQTRELALDTRNQSYFALTDKQTWHKRLMDAYREHGPLCDRAAGEIVGLPINLVSARRAELMKAGDVKKYSGVSTYTIRGQKRTAATWGVNHP